MKEITFTIKILHRTYPCCLWIWLNEHIIDFTNEILLYAKPCKYYRKTLKKNRMHLTKSLCSPLQFLSYSILKLFLHYGLYAKYFLLESYKLFRFSKWTNAIRIYDLSISIVCQYLNLWSSICLWWTYHFHAFA